MASLAVVVSLCAMALSPMAAQTGGVSPDWDLRSAVEKIGGNAARLTPLLDQVDARAWTAKGASETYVAQLESTRQQARAVASEAREVAAQPQKLSGALALYFRLRALESMVESLGQGVRKYQNPALAESMAAVLGANGASREGLQRYLVDLAAEREQQYTVMDREAQRCRGMLMQQPPAPGRKR